MAEPFKPTPDNLMFVTSIEPNTPANAAYWVDRAMIEDYVILCTQRTAQRIMALAGGSFVGPEVYEFADPKPAVSGRGLDRT